MKKATMFTASLTVLFAAKADHTYGVAQSCPIPQAAAPQKEAPVEKPATQLKPAPKTEEKKVEAPKAGRTIRVSSAAELDTYRGKGKPVVLMVGSESCGPCQVMKPVFREVAEQHPEVHSLGIEADEAIRSELNKKGLEVQSYPAILVFTADGKYMGTDHGASMEAEANRPFLEAAYAMAQGKMPAMQDMPVQTGPQQQMPGQQSEMMPLKASGMQQQKTQKEQMNNGKNGKQNNGKQNNGKNGNNNNNGKLVKLVRKGNNGR